MSAANNNSFVWHDPDVSPHCFIVRTFNINKMIFYVILVLTLASCAIPTKHTCLGIDWHEEGLRDGLSGVKPIENNFYVENCKKDHDISLNKTNYMTGYEKGISSHCTINEAR